MERKSVFAKILAILGTILVWFPILAPVLFGAVAFISRGRFLFDYLMPAEFFPIELIGTVLLLCAALIMRSRLKLIAWGSACAVLLLVGSQALAVATGLASGATEPVGLWWMLTLAGILGYAIALVVIGVGGILLLRDQFRSARQPTNKIPFEGTRKEKT